MTGVCASVAGIVAPGNVTIGVAPVLSSVSVLVPPRVHPLPAARELRIKLPIVCGLLTLMITPAGLFAVNEAVFPAPSATIPPCQFEEGVSQSYVAGAVGTQLNVISADCKRSGIERASTTARLKSTSV